MFLKLRNKFILTNLVISAIIIVVSFSGIYFSTAFLGTDRRDFDVPIEFMKTNEMTELFRQKVDEIRQEQLTRLAVTLFMIGVLTELLVFGVSYYYAERSIEPVKKAYESQKEFIANASHELKTPIAAARANFEALDTKEQPWTDNVDMELERASKLVNDLLTLARTDSGEAPRKKNEVELVKLVNKHTDLIRVRLGEKQLELESEDEIKVKIVESDFAQILDILLDNASKYSETKIKIKLSMNRLIVENDGKKISPEKMEHLFDRFYQVDKTSEGVGLGLAIAKAVSERNGWKLTAESNKSTTSFTLNF